MPAISMDQHTAEAVAGHLGPAAIRFTHNDGAVPVLDQLLATRWPSSPDSAHERADRRTLSVMLGAVELQRQLQRR